MGNQACCEDEEFIFPAKTIVNQGEVQSNRGKLHMKMYTEDDLCRLPTLEFHEPRVFRGLQASMRNLTKGLKPLKTIPEKEARRPMSTRGRFIRPGNGKRKVGAGFDRLKSGFGIKRLEKSFGEKDEPRINSKSSDGSFNEINYSRNAVNEQGTSAAGCNALGVESGSVFGQEGRGELQLDTSSSVVRKFVGEVEGVDSSFHEQNSEEEKTN